MKKTEVNAFEIAPQFLQKLPAGVLLTTKAEGVLDTMVIGWGTIGIDWSTPIVTVFVRESRYTKELLEKNGRFTINIPTEKTPDLINTIRVCGRQSGRDIDKFEVCHLTPVESESFDVPAIAQFPLTIEAEVIYKQDQDPAAIEKSLHDKHYPQGDYHTAYTAKIVNCYLLED
jgi:flavin reductase (DIM6/NTAB) family NADH-FMN oxidoreductase RutF